MIQFNKKYFLLTVILFLTEINIALFFQDRFIRPYVGDLLVVILLYCFVKSFFKVPVIPLSIGVLLFSFVVETLQYFNLVELLHLQQSKLARIVLGTSFEWIDIIAYSLGIFLVIMIETGKKTSKVRRSAQMAPQAVRLLTACL